MELFYPGPKPTRLLDFTFVCLDWMCPSSTLIEETPVSTGSWGSSTCQITANCLCKYPIIIHEQHHNVCELFHFLLIGIYESIALQLCT